MGSPPHCRFLSTTQSSAIHQRQTADPICAAGSNRGGPGLDRHSHSPVGSASNPGVSMGLVHHPNLAKLGPSFAESEPVLGGSVTTRFAPAHHILLCQPFRRALDLSSEQWVPLERGKGVPHPSASKWKGARRHHMSCHQISHFQEVTGPVPPLAFA